MPGTAIRIHPDDALSRALAAIPEELGVTREFPDAVLAEAQRVATAPTLPELDLTDIPFATIDPAGSTDLDQAFHLSRTDDGYLVRYAIADLPAFIVPGGAIDAEARQRGQTLYAPDGRIPLHPPVLSEGAASLLPGEVRPAIVWEVQLDAAGTVTHTTVRRARICSIRQDSYPGAQAAIDAGTADASLALLPTVGALRQQQERDRGGADLGTPEIDVVPDGAGYRLERREVLPVEAWNAQLSLLTGMEAARLMLAARVGILRTMPPADAEAVARFRRQAAALGHPWPEEQQYGAYLAGLDGADPADLAIRHAAAALFRGAGYTLIDGQPASELQQAAVAAPYAHVTAPLRRLVDRFGLEIAVAVSAGTEVPGWVREALPSLPQLMATSGAVAGTLDRRALDTVEAAVLSTRIGDDFDAVVLSADRGHATVQLLEPAVVASADGELAPGTRVRVRLVRADLATTEIRLQAVS